MALTYSSPPDDSSAGAARRAALHRSILAWYAAQARDFPWRRTRHPYRILVAEVMLQQTGVGRVLDRYEAFLEQFPTLHALAEAPPAEVIRAWAPLGYNRRAVNLQRTAQAVVSAHGGVLPGTVEALRALPGVGPYTAAAVASFAFGLRVPVVDTNIRRVLGRLLDGPEPVSLAQAWRLAETALPEDEAPTWHQALMDVGSTVCTAGAPRCPECPARAACVSAPAFEMGLPGRAVKLVAERRKAAGFAGSTRFYRGRIIQALREATGPLSPAALSRAARPEAENGDGAWIEPLLAGLEKDGLVRREGARVRLP